MKATTPPRAWASARTCWQTVVLPDDSGPKISVIRPRGMPPTPSARSSAIEPVGIESTACRSAEPSFMIAPRPNCFSIAEQRRVHGLAALRQALAPLRPLVRHRHPLVTLLIDPFDRSAERPRWRSVRRSGLVGVVLDDAASPCAASGSPRRSAADPTSGDRLGCADLAFGFFLASLLGRSREPIAVASASSCSAIGRPFTRTCSATSPPLIRPARERSSAIVGGERSGPDRGSDPGHEV